MGKKYMEKRTKMGKKYMEKRTIMGKKYNEKLKLLVKITKKIVSWNRISLRNFGDVNINLYYV